MVVVIVSLINFFFFFFSSRRRHTRLQGDWSSDVCSSDLNGDPDYPLVTGCVYNAANMPPWALPANATQSGIKTRSSKGGAAGAGLKNGPGDANAIRFEEIGRASCRERV